MNIAGLNGPIDLEVGIPVVYPGEIDGNHRRRYHDPEEYVLLSISQEMTTFTHGEEDARHELCRPILHGT